MIWPGKLYIKGIERGARDRKKSRLSLPRHQEPSSTIVNFLLLSPNFQTIIPPRIFFLHSFSTLRNVPFRHIPQRSSHKNLLFSPVPPVLFFCSRNKLHSTSPQKKAPLSGTVPDIRNSLDKHTRLQPELLLFDMSYYSTARSSLSPIVLLYMNYRLTDEEILLQLPSSLYSRDTPHTNLNLLRRFNLLLKLGCEPLLLRGHMVGGT